jgi:hypothetical protein
MERRKLNRVAFHRAQTRGGRPSVSALLVDLVEQHRKELEAKAAAGEPTIAPAAKGKYKVTAVNLPEGVWVLLNA